MARENGVLVIGLVERPAVTEINLEGNKAIETDQLLDALRDNGLAEGQIFPSGDSRGYDPRAAAAVCFPGSLWRLG